MNKQKIEIDDVIPVMIIAASKLACASVVLERAGHHDASLECAKTVNVIADAFRPAWTNKVDGDPL